MELKDKTFKKFSSLIYNHAGIVLSDIKKQLVKSRLAKRVYALGLKSYEEYYKHLETDNFQGAEMVFMLDAISTNKTSFFRENAHFELLKNTLLPELVEKMGGRGVMKLWSAACSTGEECYTLCIVLSEFLQNYPSMDFHILATDISTQVLQKAQLGIYNIEQAEDIGTPLMRRYFQRGHNNFRGRIRVKEELRSHCTFKRLNFMDPNWKLNDSFDIIFCRNAMIYFDKPTQARLVERFHQHLKPEGHLFIGHSESLLDSRQLFSYVQPTVYKK